MDDTGPQHWDGDPADIIAHRRAVLDRLRERGLGDAAIEAMLPGFVAATDPPVVTKALATSQPTGQHATGTSRPPR
jgi:hypothetical protein